MPMLETRVAISRSPEDSPLTRMVMRRLSLVLSAVIWVALVGLLGYELVQKSVDSPLGPLPGHELARNAERQVTFQATTGVGSVDRLLHEGQEAVHYYEQLLAQ